MKGPYQIEDLVKKLIDLGCKEWGNEHSEIRELRYFIVIFCAKYGKPCMFNFYIEFFDDRPYGIRCISVDGFEYFFPVKCFP